MDQTGEPLSDDLSCRLTRLQSAWRNPLQGWVMQRVITGTVWKRSLAVAAKLYKNRALR